MSEPHVSAVFQYSGSTAELKLVGDLQISTIPKLWNSTREEIAVRKPSRLIVDASELESCDASGIALLQEWKYLQDNKKAEFLLHGLKEEFTYLYDLSTSVQFREKWEEKSFFKDLKGKPTEIGKKFVDSVSNTQSLISFIGELTIAIFHSIYRPKLVRWKDAFSSAEKTGVNAWLIIALIGFLLGLIMSFQSAIPMRRFGAEIFVANLVGLSLFRELGPLMTAFILAGRSGSAYAAELGTMKVSEEVDALTTMGLSPVQFLVIPRIIASTLMTPLLTLVFNLLGLVGGALVLISFGYPLVTFINQIVSAVKTIDLVGGLVKSVVFGLVVGSIGCYEGLRTTTGAGAVGESTTKAVVGGIIYVAVLDGIFSIAYFYLGI
jgi:phospholipid/cholesterol/gamma-HCH transport system permease protein